MQYAFWIAIAVVFIAVAPAIYNARKADKTRPRDDGESDGRGGD
jgi:hypothetical protein